MLGAGYYHAFIANPSVTTNIGMNQILRGDNVKLVFSNVTGSGITRYAAVDPTSAIITNLTLPHGYTIENNEAAYDVTTTATFTGDVQTCVQLNGEYNPVRLNKLKLLHAEGNALVDRTSSINFRTRSLCATTTSLSPFVAARSVIPTAAAVSISGRVLSNNRGLANARVELTGANGTTRQVNTNSFGYFTFSEVEAGGTYIANVWAKRYAFAPQVISGE